MLLGGFELLILKGIAAFCIGAAVAVLIAITIAILAEWFDSWKTSNHVNYDDVGFLINEGLENGQYKAIQGVFNKGSGQVKAARRIASSQIDSELKHDKVVIFD